MKNTTTIKKRGSRKIDLSPEKKAASEARKKSLRLIADEVGKLSKVQQQIESDKLGFIESVAGFELSPFNSCFIRRQRKNASVVGGFQQWKKAGRKVKKGSKALALWLPMKKKEESEKSEASENTEEGKTFFRLVNVFDVADTEQI